MADTINIQQILDENLSLRRQVIEHFTEDETRAEQEMVNSNIANRNAILSLRQFEFQSINNANQRYLETSRTETANYNKLDWARRRTKELRRSVNKEQNSVRRLRILKKSVPQIEAQNKINEQKELDQKANQLATLRFNNMLSFRRQTEAQRLSTPVN
jgi:hypothetical protein